METPWERTQRRVFGCIIPIFLAVLLVHDAFDNDGLNDPYTPFLLLLLASYSTGLTAYILKKYVGGKDEDSGQDG